MVGSELDASTAGSSFASATGSGSVGVAAVALVAWVQITGAAGITIDYPVTGSVFPPDMAAPTFLWHDGTEGVVSWRVEFAFADGKPGLVRTLEGGPPDVGPVDEAAPPVGGVVAPEREHELTPGAYLPFGMGQRTCVGAGFAQTEASLIIARLARRFDFSALEPDKVRPVARLTTRPVQQIQCRAKRRVT